MIVAELATCIAKSYRPSLRDDLIAPIFLSASLHSGAWFFIGTQSIRAIIFSYSNASPSKRRTISVFMREVYKQLGCQ
jgi:hypothetical protein